MGKNKKHNFIETNSRPPLKETIQELIGIGLLILVVICAVLSLILVISLIAGYF